MTHNLEKLHGAPFPPGFMRKGCAAGWYAQSHGVCVVILPQSSILTDMLAEKYKFRQKTGV